MVAASTPSFLGSLSTFSSYDETPYIGTRFPDKSVQLSKIIKAPNSNELIKDLATLVSHRGVVFFSDQDLTLEQQRELAQRMGELSGKPKSSTLHKHPVTQETAEFGEIFVISSKDDLFSGNNQKRASQGWHADITFEKVPSDYAILKMHTLPPTGGDTLWASGYEAYDRLSPAFKKFLEGLTAIHDYNFFVDYAQKQGPQVVSDPFLSKGNRSTRVNRSSTLSAAAYF
ncbi:taurine catabolism dioxygenase [Dendrothele bispora CBS 962.96]|uniref:Taurine catabolism dioxygenase n=1 Tax=Dendrothele bispora (strain CBS 962.96) TaxID=1314807 RepID=A0A4S8LH16_DENBC|nr:taurine catabolism dioxygenase [Dendrothele bispora CBS 962.96]